MGFCIFKGACVGGVEFYLCVVFVCSFARVCVCVWSYVGMWKCVLIGVYLCIASVDVWVR